LNVVTELETSINEFNQKYQENFAIDTIRISYSKQYKKVKLDNLGKWKKLNANDNRILNKLKKRLTVDEITSAYQLENYNIYYYNSAIAPKYNQATMVIFGLKQYHKEAPPQHLIESILNILVFGTSKVNINIDICKDFFYKPNIEALNNFYHLTPFITKNGLITDTRYINNPEITMIEKVIIYNKQVKNNLSFKVWRAEAKVLIPNIKLLSLPLYELKTYIFDLLST